MADPFPTTSWSVVCSLRDQDPRVVRAALTVLCQAYWSPLYAFARRRGASIEGANDLTQSFFLHLLERETLAKADRARSRFRSFLLASFRHFLSHEREYASAKKRMPDRQVISLNSKEAERLYQQLPADTLTPEEIFERRWAQVVASRAWRRLESNQRKSKNTERFVQLSRYVLGDADAPPYEEAAKMLGMSLSSIKTAVHRLRQDFGKLLHAEVLPTLADPKEANDEVRHIVRLIESSDSDLHGLNP